MAVDLVALREILARALCGWSVAVSNGRLEARHPDGGGVAARLPDDLVARAKVYALERPDVRVPCRCADAGDAAG